MIKMKVADVMVREPTVVDPETPVIDAAKIMLERSIGSVILIQHQKPVGILTERDLVHRVLATGADISHLKVKDVCSKPVIAISELGDLDDASDTMREYGIRRLVVVDREDHVVGILTSDDLVYNLRSISEELAVKYFIAQKRR